MGSNEASGGQISTNEVVNDSLHVLLKTHVKDVKIQDIDEIVLSYVVGILEDLVESDDDEDSFDVDDFGEMLAAYLPEAGDIPPASLTEWMFGLVSSQRELRKSSKEFNFDLKTVIEETTRSSRVRSTSKCSSESSTDDNERKNKKLSESEDIGEFLSKVTKLQEMFPFASEAEISHCLALMGGDVDKASQLIIHRQETGQSFQPNARKVKACQKEHVSERAIRDRIVGKYGYVDQAEDLKFHRPLLKSGEDKKMIRYRDGKIVSTKGERFTQVTKQESDEMKKSYVNMQNTLVS